MQLHKLKLKSCRGGIFGTLHVLCLTWPPVSLLHPNVAVALSHTGLRVEERHSDTPLGTEPGIVVMTLLHGISIVLLPQPDTTKPETDAGYFRLLWLKDKNL